MSELLDRMDKGETTREEHQVDCKIYGCTKEATATHGPYAGLCDEHAEVAREKRYGPSRGGGSAKASSNGKGFAGQIKVLLGLARKLDRAHARLDAIPEMPDPSASVGEAIRRYQGVPSAENLAALTEATKAAQKGQPKRKLVESLVATAEREFKTELAAVARRAAS
jgi:hypothetical protein